MAHKLSALIAASSTVALVSCQAGGSPPSPAPASSVAAGASSVATTGVLRSLSTPIPIPNVVQLSVPSADVVWALVAESVLFRSTDRGNTWEQRPLPAGALNPEIAFASDREGWLSSVGPPATQCQAQGITIWHTADAGTTWESLPTSEIGTGQCKSGLSFVDTSHGFISGSDPSHPPIPYHTGDGGRTWSAAAPLGDPPGFTTRAGTSLQPDRVQRFGATLLLAASHGASTYVYRSVDGGATWTYLATAPDRPALGGFVSASRWLELSGPGESLETTDAGGSWHPYTTDYSQAAPIEPAVVFGNDLVGYATVRGAIKRTQDGGAHWVSVTTPGTSSASP